MTATENRKPKTENLRIFFTGVGGQGTLLASRVLGEAALAAGLDPLGTYRCDDATCQLIPAGQAQASRAGGTADA